MQSDLFFPLLLLVFQQGRTGGENCREGQEKSADRRAVFFGDQAGEDANGSAEEKTESELIPLRIAQGRKIDADVQSDSPHQQEPKSKGDTQP